jgi:hypothetical protein
MRIDEALAPREADADDNGGIRLWASVPPGYLEMPLEDIDERLGTARQSMQGLVPADKAALFDATIGALHTTLRALKERQVCYCGMGWHRIPGDDDGEGDSDQSVAEQIDVESLVASTLVISAHLMPERRNPRLVLADLARTLSHDRDTSDIELMDLPVGPTLFVESVNQLSGPQLPGQSLNHPNATRSVYQLRAFRPSADGTKLAVAELSCANLEAGSNFVPMMYALATTLSFEGMATEPDAPEKSRERIGDVLGAF